MTVKLTGADLNAFMADAEFWANGRWYEDAMVSINGGEYFDWDGETIEPEDMISWDGGIVYDSDRTGAGSRSLEPEIRKWMKARSVATIVIEVNKDHEADVRALLNSAPGVKVLK